MNINNNNAAPAWNEADRLAALARYHILDTPPEPAYDDIVKLVADSMDVPIAVINLIAEGRQWFKAEVGLGVRETPLDTSFCAKAILQPGGMVVPDTTEDPRFNCNPLVTGDPGLRFYAGELLETPDGMPIGTLCVLDTRPRLTGLNERQQLLLKTLARQVMTQLELRRAVIEREAAMAQQYRQEVLLHLEQQKLQAREERLQFALEGAGDGVWDWNVQTNEIYISPRWKEMLGYRPEQDIGNDFNIWANLVHSDDLPRTRASLEQCLSGHEARYSAEYRMWHQASRWVWIRARGQVVARDEDGRPLRMVGTNTDITETRTLGEELQKSYELQRRLTQQVPGVLYQFQMHADGRFSCPYVSGMTEAIFEASALEIQTDVQLVLRCVHDEDRETFFASIAQSAATLQPWRHEFRMNLPGQGLCWREGNSNPIRLHDGSTLWHGFMTDISERKRTEQTIWEYNQIVAQQANYDSLTGLPNRRLFRDRLNQEIKHSASTNRTIALLFLDLDRFKEVNDLLGHDAGDALLTQTASRIQACLDPADTVARLGGDEFTIILTEAKETRHVEQAAQQILDTLAQPFSVRDKTVWVSGSIGITVYPTDAGTAEELIRNADQAMYLAKDSGRNQLSFFKQSMQEEAISRLNLIRELREALPEKQLELYFQPIVDMDSGAIIKAEALLRWHHPSRGLLLPTEFISIAEDTGLIHAIGNWVFQEAAVSSKRWSARLGQPFQISINKSPVQFLPHQDANMMNWIAYLARLGLTKDNISIEITEGLLLNMSSQVSEKLDALQKGGIEVSIDDFGTGYSSLTYLKKLDVDYLKIDQSFVRDMLHDANTATIVETVIMMAKKLGLKVIAEGVETAEQCDWLKAQGCHYAQGFYFSEPVAAPAFEQQLFGIIPDQRSLVCGIFK